MVKIVKNPGNGRLNNLNNPNRPQCVKREGLTVARNKPKLIADRLTYGVV